MICRGAGADGPLLDSYGIEREAVGRMVLRNAGRLTRMALLRNPLLQLLRNAVAGFAMRQPAVQRRALATMTEIDIAYPETPLSRAAGPAPSGGLPKAGGRLPWSWQAGDPVGAGDAPRFALFGRDADALAARFGAVLAVRPLPAGVADGWWLVRPDGYVGLTARTGDAAAVADYLAPLVSLG